jgi:hypothetical protein
MRTKFGFQPLSKPDTMLVSVWSGEVIHNVEL